MADYIQTHWSDCWRDGDLRDHAECARRHAMERAGNDALRAQLAKVQQEIERLKVMVARWTQDVTTEQAAEFFHFDRDDMDATAMTELLHFTMNGYSGEGAKIVVAHEEQQR